jgi:hypothetical protein
LKSNGIVPKTDAARWEEGIAGGAFFVKKIVSFGIGEAQNPLRKPSFFSAAAHA